MRELARVASDNFGLPAVRFLLLGGPAVLRDFRHG